MIHSLTLAIFWPHWVLSTKSSVRETKNHQTKKLFSVSPTSTRPPQKRPKKHPPNPNLNPPPFSHLHVMIVLIKASDKSSLRGITTFPPWRLKTAVVVRIHRFSCTTRWNLPDDIRVPRWSWNNQKLNPGKTQAKENVGHMCIFEISKSVTRFFWTWCFNMFVFRHSEHNNCLKSETSKRCEQQIYM